MCVRRSFLPSCYWFLVVAPSKTGRLKRDMVDESASDLGVWVKWERVVLEVKRRKRWLRLLGSRRPAPVHLTAPPGGPMVACASPSVLDVE